MNYYYFFLNEVSLQQTFSSVLFRRHQTCGFVLVPADRMLEHIRIFREDHQVKSPTQW